MVFLILSTQARKTYLVKEADTEYIPRVQQYSCTKCSFDNESGKLCLDQTLEAVAGWKFD